MTAAGRFWCGYLLILFSLCWASTSHAGYYATVQVGAPGYCSAPFTSGCYLTIGMAIQSSCSVARSITAFDATAKTWSAIYQGSFPTSGVFGTCETLPAGGPQPEFVGSLADPSVLPTGVAGGPSSGATEEMFDTEVFTLASGAALLMFVTGFGIGLVVQLVRRLRTP